MRKHIYNGNPTLVIKESGGVLVAEWYNTHDYDDKFRCGYRTVNGDKGDTMGNNGE